MKLYISLLLVICVAVANAIGVQATSVKVSFEKDGKQIKRGGTIRFYPDEQSYYKDRGFSKGIKPKVERGAFIVPPSLTKQENVIVVFESGEYILTFFGVPTSGFGAEEWIIGVDTKPFDKENIMETMPEKDIDYAAYLKFVAADGKPVRVLINSHK